LRPDLGLGVAALHLRLEGLQRRRRGRGDDVHVGDRVVVGDRAGHDHAERRDLCLQSVHDVLAVVDHVLVVGDRTHRQQRQGKQGRG
jgi:hypothetical protein